MKIVILIVSLMLTTFFTAQISGQTVSTNCQDIVIPLNYWRAKVYTDGLAAVIDTTTNLYGFATISGEIRIPCIYGWVKDFSEDMSAVMDVQTKKWGYINRRGDTIISFIYDEAGRFGYDRDDNKGFHGLAYVNIGITEEGRTQIFADGKWGLINKKGEVVLPIKYGYISPVSEGIAFIYEGEVLRENNLLDINSQFPGKVGFINSNGEVIITPRFDFHPSLFNCGIAEVKENGKIFYINTKGKKVKHKK